MTLLRGLFEKSIMKSNQINNKENESNLKLNKNLNGNLNSEIIELKNIWEFYRFNI